MDDHHPSLTTPEGQKVDPDNFVRFVEAFDQNTLALAMSDAIAECTAATQLLHKKSTITLTLSVEHGDSLFGELMITPDVKSNPARQKPNPTAMWPTREGGLSNRDPDQQAADRRRDRSLDDALDDNQE